MNSIRTLVERFSRGRIFTRKLPVEFGSGRLTVSPEAGGLKYWRANLGGADVQLLNVVREVVRPGSRVWDIGANVGLFSFTAAFLAGTGGEVLAVEADVENAALLLKSAAASDRTRNAPVTVLPVAITSPGSRFARFGIASRSRASNALEGYGATQMGGVREWRVMPAFTLDGLLADFAPPTVVKIDVEGAELAVLQGATRLLSESRPIISMEVSKDAEMVGEILRQANYTLYDASIPRESRKPLESAAWDTLAMPRDA